MLSHQRIGEEDSETCSSSSSIQSQYNSSAANAIDLYSTFLLDLKTIFCFLALQDMRFWPRNTPYPLLDFLLSGDPAQSESQKAFKDMDEGVYDNP